MKAGTLMIKIMLTEILSSICKKNTVILHNFLKVSVAKDGWTLGSQGIVQHPGQKSGSGYRQSPLKTKYFEGCSV
nr:hypothetical protein [Pantoea sp. 201603H]